MLHSLWVKSYSKGGDALHTTCSTSLFRFLTQAFLVGTEIKYIFAKYKMMTRYYNKIVSSTTSLKGTLSNGINFDTRKFSLDNTFKSSNGMIQELLKLFYMKIQS
jgi:hypothetical protein